MISTHNGDLLSTWHCWDMEEAVLSTAGLTTGTHQNTGRILKSVGGSTESYSPHILPSVTISKQNVKLGFCFIREEFLPHADGWRTQRGGLSCRAVQLLPPMYVECEFSRSSQAPSSPTYFFPLQIKIQKLERNLLKAELETPPEPVWW